MVLCFFKPITNLNYCILKLFSDACVCTCVHPCVCAHSNTVLMEAEEDIKAGVVGSYKLPDVGAGNRKLGALKKQ